MKKISIQPLTDYTMPDGKTLGVVGLSKKQELVVKIPNYFANLRLVGDFIFGMSPGRMGIADGLHLLAYVGKERILELPSFGEEYRIAKEAFGYKNIIKSITIPSCVVGIANEAFGCKTIIEVVDHSNLNIAEAVEENPIACGSIVGCAACTDKQYMIHKNDKSLIEESKGVYYLTFPNGKRVCVGCNGRKNIVRIAADIEDIANVAFRGEPKMKQVKLPKKLVTIGSHAFDGCGSLSSVKIPDSVQQIGSNAFTGSALRSVSFGSGISVIPEYCFCACDSLDAVEIPRNVTCIKPWAFGYCDVLSRVRFVNPTGWKVVKENVSLNLSNPMNNAKTIKQYENKEFICS